MKKTLIITTAIVLVLFGCEKNNPPSCEIVSPVNSSEIMRGELVTLSVKANDSDGSIQEVRFYIDNIEVASIAELPYKYSWETDDVELGDYVIRALAIDDKKLEGKASIEIEIVAGTVDEMKPTVKLISPDEEATVRGTINIVATGKDNIGVEYVEFMIKDEDWVVFEKDSTSAYFQFSASLNTTLYPDGLIMLSITAYDAAGNHGEYSFSVYIDNAPDTEVPVVEIFAPQNNQTVSGHITLQARVTDNIGIDHVNFKVLDGTWTLLGTDYYAVRGNEYAILWDTKDTPDGTYGIKAVAWDSAGNEGYDRIGITIDNSGSVAGDDSFIYEGRKYFFKTIGTQTWMVDNLAYIDVYGHNQIDPAPAFNYWVYGYFGSDGDVARHLDNYEEYGVLYNWYAAKTACPSGWHLPSDEEWKTLEKYLGMSTSDADVLNWRDSGDVGFKLKSTSGWINDGNGDNSSGFQAIPGGLNKENQSVNLGSEANFWSSSQDMYGNCMGRTLISEKDGILRTYFHHGDGASVRCLKDE